MKAAVLLSNLLRYMAAGVLVLVLGTSCQKSNDDFACPHNNDNTTQGTTRDLEVSNGRLTPDPTGGSTGGQLRGGETNGPTGGDEGGISDDGDDEADKESSSKPRPGH